MKSFPAILFVSLITNVGFAAPSPNIVVFLADDMGMGDTSAYQSWSNPLSPPSAPVQMRLQSPPAKSKFLAVVMTAPDPATTSNR
jgi:hypothetical protein